MSRFAAVTVYRDSGSLKTQAWWSIVVRSLERGERGMFSRREHSRGRPCRHNHSTEGFFLTIDLRPEGNKLSISSSLDSTIDHGGIKMVVVVILRES